MKSCEKRGLNQQEFIDESLDALQDIFYLVTDIGKLRRWNERFSTVSEYTDEELNEMDVTELFVDEYRERISESIEETIKNRCVCCSADILTADGERRTFEFRGPA